MDAPYYSGEPGALFSDREWDARGETLTKSCVGCGKPLLVLAREAGDPLPLCDGCYRRDLARRIK